MIPRLGQLVLDLPSSYGLKGPFIHSCVEALSSLEEARGRPLGDDHARQEAVKWARLHSPEMQAYWKKFYECSPASHS